MPLEPFRFLHCANLYLDHQLQGIGPVPAHLRETLEQATLLTWDRIVATAIERQVEFLLLAGNTFDAADHSLRGQVALVRGLELLAQHDIPVFIAPGTADPDVAWRLGMSLPDNVTRFGGELNEPVSLSRDGATFCTLHHVMANIRDLNATDANGLNELAFFAPHLSSSDAGPFDIALLEPFTDETNLPSELLESISDIQVSRHRRFESSMLAHDSQVVAECPIDYWALGIGVQRQSWRVSRGMAHTPGSPQGLSPNETGSLGCTLVDVQDDGQVRESFIPTARVRWEVIHTTVAPTMPRDTVLHELKCGLEALPRHPHDELWLVTWHITGSGPSFEDLQDDDCAHRLWNDAVQALMGSSLQCHLRRIRYTDNSHDSSGLDFLAREFARQLTGWNGPDLIEHLLSATSEQDPNWGSRLKSILTNASPQDVVQDAQRLGWAWLKQGV